MNILWQEQCRCIFVSRDTHPLFRFLIRYHGRDLVGGLVDGFVTGTRVVDSCHVVVYVTQVVAIVVNVWSCF